jgi:hypothetical protein
MGFPSTSITLLLWLLTLTTTAPELVRSRSHQPSVQYLGYVEFERGSARIANGSRPFLDDLRTLLDSDTSKVGFVPAFVSTGERESLQKARLQAIRQYVGLPTLPARQASDWDQCRRVDAKSIPSNGCPERILPIEVGTGECSYLTIPAGVEYTEVFVGDRDQPPVFACGSDGGLYLREQPN